MSMSNIPQDTDDIVVPPFPFSEEEEIVEDPNTVHQFLPGKIPFHFGRGVSDGDIVR